MDLQKEYTIDEVAKLMGMSLKMVRRYVASGELRTTKTNNAFRINEDALIAFRQYISEGGYEKRLEEMALAYKNGSQSDDMVNWADITPYWNNTSKSNMTFVDLFCGAGGLSKGLEMAGLEGICGLDSFKEACMTYGKNFNHSVVNGDIKDIETKKTFYEIVRKSLAGRQLNVVAGGFPCQGFSMAGNRIIRRPSQLTLQGIDRDSGRATARFCCLRECQGTSNDA